MAPQQSLQQAIELHRSGRIAEAESLFQGILARQPRNLAALQHLAIIHANRGAFAEAEKLFRRALDADPASADAHSNLGRVLAARGLHREATACFERALSLRPGMVEAEFNLGALHQKLGRPAAAVDYLRRVVTRQPAFTAAHCLLAVALQEDGKGDEAIGLLTRAIAARPREAALHHALGRLQTSAGDITAARQSFEAAIALQPTLGVAYYDLSQIHRFATGDPRIAAMERMLGEAAAFSLDERIGLHLALYKALADTGRIDDAFTHLAAANAARRATVAYDEAAALERWRSICRVFDASLLARHAQQGSSSRLPIFVVGFPRSGTTLVEQILASHPRVHGAGERTDIDGITGKLFPPGSALADPPAALHGPALAALGDDLARRFASLSPGAAHVVDKMPANYRHLGVIHLILPQAAIIHVRRDPMDTCFSCFENDFGHRQPFSYDLGELGRCHGAYRAIMAHWRRVLPAGRILEIDYEAIVSDPAGQVGRLLDHCGLDWDARCLNFHETRRAVFTQSQAQVRRPLYTSSVGRWRRFERQLAPLLASLQQSPD